LIINQKLINFFQKNIIVLLFLLIIYFFHYRKNSESLKNSINIKNKSNEVIIINNYKLFNETENPFLSLILNLSTLNFTNETFFNFISDASKSINHDIQIILLYEPLTNIIQNTSKKSFLKNMEIETFSFDAKDWSKSFYDLLNLIKGRFLIIIDKIINIEKIGFNRIYHLTKGNISNIFKLYNQNNEILYVLRTKILRDIMDLETQFPNYNDLINYINALPTPKLNYIPIAYCPNNFYSSLTYTSMISILVSKGYYTYISFYLIVPLYFSKDNIQFIESLYEQFDYFNITFLEMDNRYEKAFINRYITTNAYFRMSLGELLPNLNKIIYLDSDTICLKDLSDLYSINFKGKIFIARIIKFKTGNLNFTINSGVLLLNLLGMRKLKIEKKVLTLLNNGFKDPFHDQAIINNYFKKYIGFLPPAFNSITFNYNKVKERKKNFGELYDFDSLYFSFKHPYIIHYPGNPQFKTYNKEDWYYFARKSKYFKKRTHNYSNIFKYTFNKN